MHGRMEIETILPMDKAPLQNLELRGERESPPRPEYRMKQFEVFLESQLFVCLGE